MSQLWRTSNESDWKRKINVRELLVAIQLRSVTGYCYSLKCVGLWNNNLYLLWRLGTHTCKPWRNFAHASEAVRIFPKGMSAPGRSQTLNKTSNVIKESSTSCANHLSVVSILQVWRSCHYLINIFLAHSMPYFSDHYREGFHSDPPGVLLIWILGTRIQVAWIQRLPIPEMLFPETNTDLSIGFLKVLWSSFLS